MDDNSIWQALPEGSLSADRVRRKYVVRAHSCLAAAKEGRLIRNLLLSTHLRTRSSSPQVTRVPLPFPKLPRL